MDLGTAVLVVAVILMIVMHARGHGHPHGATGGAHTGHGHGGHGHADRHAADDPEAETAGPRRDVEQTDAAPRKHGDRART